MGSLTEDREGNKRSIGLLPILHSAFFLLHSSDRPQTAPTLPPYRLACCKAPLSNLRMQKEECRMKKGPGEATTQGMQKAECRMKKGPGEATTQGMQNEECRMKKGPGKATLMRHQCDIKATSMRVASQAVATFMRPQSHLHATSKPPPCDLKATFMRPQGSHKAPSKLGQRVAGRNGSAGMEPLARGRMGVTSKAFRPLPLLVRVAPDYPTPLRAQRTMLCASATIVSRCCSSRKLSA